MTDDLITLRAEIARLRDLLEDHGIDPDPAPPEPEQYGPPTYMMWRMQQMFAATVRSVVQQHTTWITERGFWEGDQWVKPGTTLRVRVPNSFKVFQSHA